MAEQTDVYCPVCEREEVHFFYDQTVECDGCTNVRYYDADLLYHAQFAVDLDNQNSYDYDDDDDD